MNALRTHPLVIVLFVIAAAVASAAAPLLVYSTTLALFGLAHVMTEMFYVDHRFGKRVQREVVVGAAVLLTGVVLVRALRMVKVLGDGGAIVEMCLVCALGALALPTLWRRGALPFVVGVVVVGGLAFGTMLAPLLTLVVLAIVHNATPVGFLVEKAPPAQRLRILAVCTVAYVVVPIVVASGAVSALFGGTHADAAVLNVGPLHDHLYVYLPRSLFDAVNAPDLFAGVVCAQVLHYGAVIGILPRLVDDTDRSILAWPSLKWLAVVVALLGAGLFAHFAVSFVQARALYGLAAGVHAWVEVPVLLLALAGVTASTERRAASSP